jgi:hypothetical protein
MLYPLYALRKEGHEAEYNALWALEAVHSFLQQFPHGEETYFEGLRYMYSAIYTGALAGSNKSYFLDKTPRYYHIIPELYRIFPEAHFVILLRNPLAVFCSIIKNWVQEEWLQLQEYRHDLLEAPYLLLEGIELLGKQCLVVHYEQLLTHPLEKIGRICEKLNVEFLSSMIQYDPNMYSQYHFGYQDQQGIFKKGKLDINNIDKWIHALQHPQTWRLVNDYLQFLGHDTIEQMGYSYETLQQLMHEHRPHQLSLWRTFPLEWVIKKPNRQKKQEYKHHLIKLLHSLQSRGMAGTLIRFVKKVFKINS